MAEFRMPSLGADMDAGTVITWRIAPGDHVTKGEIVADVDTEKSVIEVETFATGTVEEILVREGERVAVGTPLAIIREDALAEGGAPSAAPPPASVRGRAASPRARRRAEEIGVDLAAVTGTGPGGAITADDVERAAAGGEAPPRPEAPPEPESPAPEAPAEPAAPAPEPLTGADRQAALRRAIAASMARSKREIPHYYLTADIDATRAVRWLEQHNASHPVTERLLPAAVLLKATALALRETPDLNGFWEADGFRPGTGIHLGVAIALRGGGLVAPAIADADRKPLPELMAALRELVGRARAGRLRSTEIGEPTITVTNLGDQGVDSVLPVIYPPQVAIVGFGRLRDRPWVADGAVVVRPVVTASLAADHRASDGHRGAVLLAAIDRLLQTPDLL